MTAAAIVDDRASSGIPRVANQRSSLWGASPAAGPLPAPSSLRHGDGQAACADARHGKRPSLSSTWPAAKALPPEHASRRSDNSSFGGGALVTYQCSPQKGVSYHASRRGLFRLLDLGSGEEDDVFEDRRFRLRIRLRRRRRLPRAVIAVEIVNLDCSSSLSQQPPLRLALAATSASSLCRVARYWLRLILPSPFGN